MAGTKSNDQRHSGFDVPAFGEMYPKGTTVKHNPDGTITLVPPKGQKPKKTRETPSTRKK